MAEGFARHLGGGQLRAKSAGIESHGLNPRAVTAMYEIGIDIRQQRSKVVDPSMLKSADLVVTVCDQVKEHCPVVPAHVRQLHWSFDDPAKARGTDEEITSIFRRVRDEIGEHVRGLIGNLQEQNIGKES